MSKWLMTRFAMGLCFSVGFVGQGFAANAEYLAVGGGYLGKVQSSQVALETNLELFRDSAMNFGISDDEMTRFFAAGPDAEEPDVYVEIAEEIIAETYASELLIMRKPHYLARHNEIDPLNGEATVANLQSAFAGAARDLKGGDSFRFYFSGHGSPKQEGRYDNNVLMLWDETYSVQQMAEDLGTLDPDLHVQVVMVQCYAGGFAQMVFEGADTEAEPTNANQCGFFSQVRNKMASGCSTDVNYRKEYSPFFFAAITGESEKGESVDADYNADGVVTSNEAHAYVIAHEDSFDNPVSTSSEFIRYRAEEFSDVEVPEDMRLRALLNDEEIYVFDELSRRVGYEGDPSLKSIPVEWHIGLGQAQGQLRGVSRELNQLSESKVEARTAFEQSINDMPSDFVQSVLALETREEMFEALAEKFATFETYQPFVEATLAAKSKTNDLLAAMHQRALWERLRYLYLTKVLEYKMQVGGAARTVSKYQQLRNCESAPFFVASDEG